MRKSFVGIVLLSGILLTPTVAFADSAVILSMPSAVQLRTVNSSSTSQLHGIVTPLEKSPFQFHGSTSSMITPNSTTAPTSYWDINTLGNYDSSFSEVSNATGIYTNYYFSSSLANQLKVDVYVTGENSATTQYAMWLFDKTAGGGIVYSNILSCGQSYTVTYPSLNPTHFYYVGWSAEGSYQYIDGSFEVHY